MHNKTRSNLEFVYVLSTTKQVDREYRSDDFSRRRA